MYLSPTVLWKPVQKGMNGSPKWVLEEGSSRAEVHSSWVAYVLSVIFEDGGPLNDQGVFAD